ncbi:gamma carbonic anhydrase family protein [Dyella sp. LX-66]|uniref:gamma carbonic anhydrase family protein n=1 Tax=unclassified Dyella TaxID=2634549 RepID=UPI001BE04D56|nr:MULTISPECIES: gamma carbonic anhydrase family protein [unclassified Dyella]MBT2118884.1 gamma carbonic anhydrase family protein [Dyella sp. LX-1]MBT2140123.1 gamma carbonic anhydrase family protein [Dyella sp. LX-66]
MKPAARGKPLPDRKSEVHSNYFALEDSLLELGAGSYIAPSAVVVGDVHIGQASSIWFGAVLRGDNDRIAIGSESNIQDNAVLHTDPGIPLVVGDKVSVGHLVMLHGCTVGDGSLIGIGAVVLNRAEIGRNCLIGAKSLVTEGKRIPDHSIVQGVPGRVVGEVTERHLAMMERAAQSYVARIRRYVQNDIRSL